MTTKLETGHQIGLVEWQFGNVGLGPGGSHDVLIDGRGIDILFESADGDLDKAFTIDIEAFN